MSSEVTTELGDDDLLNGADAGTDVAASTRRTRSGRAAAKSPRPVKVTLRKSTRKGRRASEKSTGDDDSVVVIEEPPQPDETPTKVTKSSPKKAKVKAKPAEQEIQESRDHKLKDDSATANREEAKVENEEMKSEIIKQPTEEMPKFERDVSDLKETMETSSQIDPKPHDLEANSEPSKSSEVKEMAATSVDSTQPSVANKPSSQPSDVSDKSSSTPTITKPDTTKSEAMASMNVDGREPMDTHEDNVAPYDAETSEKSAKTESSNNTVERTDVDMDIPLTDLTEYDNVNGPEGKKMDETDVKDSAEKQDEENGPDDAGSPEKEATESAKKAAKEESKHNFELERHWKPVKENPHDFTSWTYLLQYTEQENIIEDAREAFENFFVYYPYCFGYWKKLADMEKRHGNLECAEKVFNDGVEAIPLSQDLWQAFIRHYKEKFGRSETEEAISTIRGVYEQALEACGADYKSDKLWESYIAWEKECGSLKKVTAAYDKLLATPTYYCNQHFKKFQEHVHYNDPAAILETEEFEELRNEYLEKNKDSLEESEEKADKGGKYEDDIPPEADDEKKKKKKKSHTSDGAETRAIRQRIIDIRQQVYKKTDKEVVKRYQYEEGIRRPYFHVKPLERVQLKNWKEYLEFEMREGDKDRIVLLFERCMIATALYEDFWIKYAKYMETVDMDAAHEVYARACKIHVPKKANIHLAWASLEEMRGDANEAWRLFEIVEEIAPKLLLPVLKKIVLKCRQGEHDAVEKLYEQHIAAATASPGNKKRQLAIFYYCRFARYWLKVRGVREKAVEALNAASELDQANPNVYMQLLDVEYQSIGAEPMNKQRVSALYEKAISSSMALPHKISFVQRYMEYVEEYACVSDLTCLNGVQEKLQKLMKEHQQETKKRNREASGSEGGESTKKPRTDTSAAVPAYSAQPSSYGTTHAPPNPAAPPPPQQQQYDYQQWANYQNYYNQSAGYYGAGYGHYPGYT